MMNHPLQTSRTTAQQSANRENMLKTMTKKKNDDIRNILENFKEILQLMKVDEDRSAPLKVQMVEQEQLEMSVRATNIVRGCESLMKLTEELKRYFFLNDFQFITHTVQNARETHSAAIKDNHSRMMAIYREMQTELHDIESEYATTWYLRTSELPNGHSPPPALVPKFEDSQMDTT